MTELHLLQHERAQTALQYAAGLQCVGAVRAPHHTVSPRGLVGNAERPGELSLAHDGVLVLNELQEWSGGQLLLIRDVLVGAYATYRLSIPRVVVVVPSIPQWFSARRHDRMMQLLGVPLTVREH